MGRTFLSVGIDGAPTTDFNPFNAAQDLNGAGPFYSQAAAAGAIALSALMPHVWAQARAEWMVRFP